MSFCLIFFSEHFSPVYLSCIKFFENEKHKICLLVKPVIHYSFLDDISLLYSLSFYLFQFQKCICAIQRHYSHSLYEHYFAVNHTPCIY